MKIFNKFIWSKKEPSNKNDVWFDGSTWRMYTEEAWQSFTLPVDAADKVAKVLENASEVYQEKLNAGYGIVIEDNTISLDVSSIDVNTTHNIGSIELFDQLIKNGSRYKLHEDDIKAIQEGKLITTTKFGTKIPVISVNHMMQSSTSIAGYTLIFYVDAVLYNMSIYSLEIVGGLSWKTHLDSLAPDSNFISNSYNAIQNAIVTKKFEETDAKFTELEEQTTEQLTELSAEIDQYSPLQLALKDKSYSYVFKGNENSIATLRNPITLSKNGDSFEIEVNTDAKDALGAYPLSLCSPSGYAIGIAMDYISIRDIQGNWLLLTNIVPSSSQHLVKIQYADDKIYVYINGILKNTINSQSDVRIESFGNGGRGSYGYWKGTILSMKVNGEQYELYKNAILGDVEIVDSETNSFLNEKEKEELHSIAVLEPLVEKVKDWSYNYEFKGNSDSIATLNKPIILSKDGDSLEVEVFTEMKGANNSYTFAAKSTSPSIALGIAADYVALRDVNNNWLYLSNTPLSNTQKVKIEYIGGKVLLYINDVLKSTTETQSDIRIDSFGDGSHGTYGYWKGTILSIKVNGEQYDLQENAILGDVVKSDSPSNSLLTDAEKKTLDSFQPTMLVRKTSETLQVGLNIPSSPYYVVYNLVKKYKAYQEGAYPSFMDNWGLKKPFVGKVANGMFVQVDRIFSYGEAEIAVGVTDPNQPQYSAIVGGAAHGFDNIINTDGNRGFLLLVDSKKIDEDSELEMRPCQEVTLLQHSELCQAYTNSNPWANATKLWTLTPTSAKLKCSISILRDIKIYNGYMGMFCVERHFNGDASAPYMTSKIIKNNKPFKVFVCEDGWSDKDLQIADSECTEVTLYGDTDYGYAVRVLQSSKTKGHGMFVHYNSPSNTYNKVYPQVAANYDAKTGDIISNEVEFVIRKSSEL